MTDDFLWTTGGSLRPLLAYLRLPAALLAGLCIIAGTAGCKEEAPPPVEVVRPVKMMTIGEAAGAGKLEYPGSIRAALRSEMAFEVPGKIIEFPVLEGQRVEPGQLLARLDARDFEARMASARAQVNKAQADFDRGQSIRREDPGAIAQVTLDTYQQALEVAQANYQEAEKAVQDTILRAPFAGTVARKLVDDFANVQAKEPVLILEDDDHLEIQVTVPEQDVSQGRRDLSLEQRTRVLDPKVVVSSIPDRSFPARLKEFSTTADPVTRTFVATLAFDNPKDVRVLPGMTAKVMVDRSRAAGTERVPVTAVLTDDSNKPFVWLVDPSTMRVSRRSVELGQLTDSEVEVRSGLSEGNVIVTSGVTNLREGMQVRRFEKKQAAGAGS